MMFVNFQCYKYCHHVGFQAYNLNWECTEGTLERVPAPTLTPTPVVSPQAGNVPALSLGPRAGTGPGTVAQQRSRVWQGCAGEIKLGPDTVDVGRGRPTHQVEGSHTKLHPSFKVPMVLSFAVL